MADEKTSTDSSPSEGSPTPIAEISHEPSKFDQFLEQHQKKLIIVAFLAVMGLLAALTWSGLQKMDQQDAGSALYNAKTADELKKVISEQSQPDTKATASMLLAREQAKTDSNAAIATLENLIGSYPQSAITNDAKLDLALLLHKEGQSDKAMQNLEALASDKEAGATQVFAFYAIADISLKSGDKAKAQEFFDKAAKASSNPKVQNQLDEFKNYAGYEPPVRIQPRPKETSEEKKPEIKSLEDAP